MKTSTIMAAATLLSAAPAAAQTAPMPAPSPAPPPVAVFTVQPIPPTDPVRLAAARAVIDRIWPLGNYARMMHIMMGPFMQGVMAQTFNMKPSELLAGLNIKSTPGDPTSDNETLGQMAAKSDPYFQQRIAIAMNVMGDEMGKLMTQAEPGIRDALAHAYARRFTVAQLSELDHFLATPTGAAYASDSVTLMMSPDMAQAMQDFLPNMVKAAPGIIARVSEATKALPPPPAKAPKP